MHCSQHAQFLLKREPSTAYFNRLTLRNITPLQRLHSVFLPQQLTVAVDFAKLEQGNSTKLCPKSYATALVKPPIGMVMVFANV
jgi:hypothetical protein